MSFAANPNRPKRTLAESEAAAAARQQRADRERIRRLIITLGDDNKKVVGQVRGLAGALEDDVELHGEIMSETLLDCTKSLPLKTGIYAAWTARMMDKHATWVCSVVPRVLDELRAALRGGQAMVAQLLLRFLVGLGNCGVLGLTALLGLLQEVLALSDGLRPAKGGDLGVFLALASLPFISEAAYQKVTSQIDAVIGGASTYVASREARWKPLLRFLKTDEVPDRLEALAAAARAQKEANWGSQSIFHVPGFEPNLDGNPRVSPLPPLGITAEDIRKSKLRLQVPMMASCLTLHASHNDGADDQMSDHDRWILEDYILLTIEMFSRDVEECARQILKIPVLHPHFEMIAVETVVSQLLRLPSPPHLPLFYSRLLEAMMDKQTSTKPIVEQAFRALIGHASDLDEECLEVLAEAFAYYLMHNGYKTDWGPFTGDSVAVQAQRFVRRTLERLQRLSFHQNLLHRLPEAVHVYVPPEPLPASGLPAQTKPEFQRMLGFARIKEPSEEKVLHYCRRLMKVQMKQEVSKEEEPAHTALRPVTTEGEEAHRDGRGACKAEADLHAKRRRLSCGDEQETVAQVEVVMDSGSVPEIAGPDAKDDTARDPLSRDPPKGGDDEAGAPCTGLVASSPRGPLDAVKEEVKHEEDHPLVVDLGVAAREASPLHMETDVKAPNEDEFGSTPSEAWSLESVVELFVVALLQNGAKTPTHMGKMLDGHQNVFSSLRPAGEEEAHEFSKAIVHCIFAFWRCSSQRLGITVDMMLHRGILTSRAVVEQALAERGPQGCDSMAVWNMINSVARKSLEHSQSVRVDLAIAKKLGKNDLLETCRRQLDGAIHETAELFTLTFTGLVRNHQDFEDRDTLMRHIMLQRILTIGRKYHAFIKPLIDAAESRIPGVAHNPEIAAIFQSLSTL